MDKQAAQHIPYDSTRLSSEPDDANLVILFVIGIACFLLLCAIGYLVRLMFCPQWNVCECTCNKRRQVQRNDHEKVEDVMQVGRSVGLSKPRYSMLPRAGGHRGASQRAEYSADASTSASPSGKGRRGYGREVGDGHRQGSGHHRSLQDVKRVGQHTNKIKADRKVDNSRKRAKAKKRDERRYPHKYEMLSLETKCPVSQQPSLESNEKITAGHGGHANTDPTKYVTKRKRPRS